MFGAVKKFTEIIFGLRMEVLSFKRVRAFCEGRNQILFFVLFEINSHDKGLLIS